MTLDGVGTMEDVRYYEVPFACFDVIAAWDEDQGLWQATDNGLAVASWLTAYDQWPSNWNSIIRDCGVHCCQEEFYAFGNLADEVARRLVITLLYLNQVRPLTKRQFSMNQEFDMSLSFENLKNQAGSQLDLTFRIVQANGEYAEKAVAAHFAMLQALLQKAQAPESCSSEHAWNALSEKGSVLTDYCKSCLRDGLDYQKQVLEALSRK